MPSVKNDTDTDVTVTGGSATDNGDEVTVLNAIKQYREEAEQARATREKRNDENTAIYMGNMDWSHKTAGQSTEELPMLAMAVEQIAGFTKRALVNFSDWFSVDVSKNSLLNGEQIRSLLLQQLNTMSRVDPTRVNFPTLVSDGLKVALLRSLLIFKVYGKDYNETRYEVEKGVELLTLPLPSGEEQTVRVPKTNIKQVDKPCWHLCIDLVDTKDYLPDPSGRGLYEIHEVERDLHEVVALAGAGTYDKSAVDKIEEDFAAEERAYRDAMTKGQEVATPPAFRKRVKLTECWGTFLDKDGKIAHENAVATMANDKYLIRKPEDNGYWHGQSPFVVVPLIRVPFSVWHKALADHAAPLNVASNELFSLMLDGSMSAVHGIKQLRTDFLEHPEDVSGGIAVGTTLAVKAEMPENTKVLERVDAGELPPEAMAMYSTLDREFQQAMMTSDIKTGQLPEKAVKATELVQADQAQAGFFDSLIRDLEDRGISMVLWKAWMVMIQEMDNLHGRDYSDILKPEEAEMLGQLSPEERYVLFQDVRFTVRGLTATLENAKNFQKLMAMMQAVGSNPMMLQAFFNKYNPEKIIAQSFKFINLNPTNFEMTAEEMQQVPNRMQQLPTFMGAAGGKGGTPEGPSMAGGPQAGGPQQAAINQTSNPLTGISGGEG